MRFKITISILLLLIIFSGLFFLGKRNQRSDTPIPTFTPTPTVTPTPIPRPAIILHDVPFTSQAPSFQWENPYYQYACEEASILMAMAWVQGKEALPVAEVEQEIMDLSTHAEEVIGTYRDESAEDTVRLLKSYYGYENVELYPEVTTENIIDALYDGNVVMLPMNGQKLNNPYYTPPGPIEHMMVVIGYDSTTDEFITNDPGTRQGRQYRFPVDVFENAIQDYPTGDHEPILEIHKPMIVVKPSSTY